MIGSDERLRFIARLPDGEPIAQKAHREGTSLREAGLALRLVSAEDFGRWMDPVAMTRPG